MWYPSRGKQYLPLQSKMLQQRNILNNFFPLKVSECRCVRKWCQHKQQYYTPWRVVILLCTVCKCGITVSKDPVHRQVDPGQGQPYGLHSQASSWLTLWVCIMVITQPKFEYLQGNWIVEATFSIARFRMLPKKSNQSVGTRSTCFGVSRKSKRLDWKVEKKFLRRKYWCLIPSEKISSCSTDNMCYKIVRSLQIRVQKRKTLTANQSTLHTKIQGIANVNLCKEFEYL